MKKFFFAAAMAMMAFAANAQDQVKQADKLIKEGKFGEAVEVLKPALNDGTAAQKAAAWNALSNAHYQQFAALQQIQVENQVKQTNVPIDEALYNRSIAEALKAAIQCDVYDNEPNEKGKIKPKFRTANAQRFQTARLNVINSGQYEYNNKNVEAAFEDWALYVESAKSPLFTGIDMSKDQYYSQVAYFAGLAAYNLKKYDEAVKYANIAAEDTAKAADALEIIIFSRKEGAKTKEDTLAYVNTLRDLHKQQPAEQRWFNLLLDYYVQPSRAAELKAWVDEELAIDPNNKMAWALKGESEMNAGNWDSAIEAYKKAAELDPTFVQVWFNAGVCLNSKAVELKDKLSDKNTGKITTENANKVIAVLKDALGYMEKAKELDPNQEKVKWVYPMYQIYYNMGDKAKIAEYEKLLNN